MGWTDERVEIVKSMWMEGASASAIARRLGGVTRNAVIGKVTRLCLDRPQDMNRRNRARNGRRAGKEHSKAAKMQFGKGQRIPTPSAPPPSPPPIPTVHVSTFTGAIIPGPSPIPPRPLPEPAKALGPLIDINAITSRNCCWPVERDPVADEWLFCGVERDPKSGVGRERGYCTAHWRKSLGRAA